MNALMVAAENGHLEVVKQLISSGASVDATDKVSVSHVNNNSLVNIHGSQCLSKVGGGVRDVATWSSSFFLINCCSSSPLIHHHKWSQNCPILFYRVYMVGLL